MQSDLLLDYFFKYKIMKFILSFLIGLVATNGFAQHYSNDSLSNVSNHHLEFKYKSLIIPSALIGYGFIGLKSQSIKDLNIRIKNKLTEPSHESLHIDDYSQYVPMLSVYALNALGLEGKNRFKERTVILATAYIIMGSTILSTKKLAAIERPDGSGKNSFPSGHTATTFVGAEFLHQEFKDQSIWFGIAGYTIAAGTGYLRMYNNRHWLSDVVAGAGVGILSTKIAYWINPFIMKKIFKSDTSNTSAFIPYYNSREYGLGLSIAL